jgi:3-hydroxypropanoate dehydrogenase
MQIVYPARTFTGDFPMTTISQAALDHLFFNARTANGFTEATVQIDVLKRAYEIAAMAPTSMNSQPTRYVFLTTPQAKERLMPALAPGNVDKTRSAPVTVIVATDMQFYEHMPQIWHGAGAREMFAGNAALAEATAIRNGTLGGAYFILAARAVGLDCGPMSGFDIGKVNAEFFPDGRYAKEFARNPRLSFNQAAQVL